MSGNYKYMWECGFLVFTALLVLITAQEQQQQPPKDPYDQLTDYWFSKCLNQTKSTEAFDKLFSNTVEFKRYLKYAFKYVPGEKKTFCNNERQALLNRMKEVTNNLRPCLSEKEKYMEDFIYTSFSEFLHFLCHNNGENMDVYFSASSNECRNKLLNSTDPQIISCYSKLFKPSNPGQPTKKELCGDLNVVKQCFAQTLSQECPSYTPYKKLNDEFFKYVNKPCSGCAFYINTVLLTLSILASYLFSR